jgi:hypothetical protein
MPNNIIVSTLALAAIIEGSSAFAPAQSNARVGTSLNAESSRRDMLGNFAKVLGAGAIAVGSNQSIENAPQLLAGLTNPAQESWRGKVSEIVVFFSIENAKVYLCGQTLQVELLLATNILFFLCDNSTTEAASPPERECVLMMMS